MRLTLKQAIERLARLEYERGERRTIRVFYIDRGLDSREDDDDADGHSDDDD